MLVATLLTVFFSLTGGSILSDCPIGGYRADPNNCRLFHHCSLNSYPKSCGFMMYNPIKQVCDWPASVIQIRPECRDESRMVFEGDTNTVEPSSYKRKTLRMLRLLKGFDNSRTAPNRFTNNIASNNNNKNINGQRNGLKSSSNVNNSNNVLISNINNKHEYANNINDIGNFGDNRIDVIDENEVNLRDVKTKKVAPPSRIIPRMEAKIRTSSSFDSTSLARTLSERIRSQLAAKLSELSAQQEDGKRLEFRSFPSQPPQFVTIPNLPTQPASAAFLPSSPSFSSSPAPSPSSPFPPPAFLPSTGAVSPSPFTPIGGAIPSPFPPAGGATPSPFPPAGPSTQGSFLPSPTPQPIFASTTPTPSGPSVFSVSSPTSFISTPAPARRFRPRPTKLPALITTPSSVVHTQLTLQEPLPQRPLQAPFIGPNLPQQQTQDADLESAKQAKRPITGILNNRIFDSDMPEETTRESKLDNQGPRRRIKIIPRRRIVQPLFGQNRRPGVKKTRVLRRKFLAKDKNAISERRKMLRKTGDVNVNTFTSSLGGNFIFRDPVPLPDSPDFSGFRESSTIIRESSTGPGPEEIPTISNSSPKFVEYPNQIRSDQSVQKGSRLDNSIPQDSSFNELKGLTLHESIQNKRFRPSDQEKAVLLPKRPTKYVSSEELRSEADKPLVPWPFQNNKFWQGDQVWKQNSAGQFNVERKPGFTESTDKDQVYQDYTNIEKENLPLPETKSTQSASSSILNKIPTFSQQQTVSSTISEVRVSASGSQQ